MDWNDNSFQDSLNLNYRDASNNGNEPNFSRPHGNWDDVKDEDEHELT